MNALGFTCVSSLMHEDTYALQVETTITSKPIAWTSEAWLDFFRYNAEHLISIPWETGAELTDDERDAIASSVQAFQLGESSEGRHLQQCATDWGQQTGDQGYAEAIQLFIKEEQRHARELGRFLELNGVGLVQKTWTDSLFRSVRRLAKLEFRSWC